jgi:hypothetical protein
MAAERHGSRELQTAEGCKQQRYRAAPQATETAEGCIAAKCCVAAEGRQAAAGGKQYK